MKSVLGRSPGRLVLNRSLDTGPGRFSFGGGRSSKPQDFILLTWVYPYSEALGVPPLQIKYCVHHITFFHIEQARIYTLN